MIASLELGFSGGSMVDPFIVSTSSTVVWHYIDHGCKFYWLHNPKGKLWHDMYVIVLVLDTVQAKYYHNQPHCDDDSSGSYT